jgi:hypothetical protein
MRTSDKVRLLEIADRQRRLKGACKAVLAGKTLREAAKEFRVAVGQINKLTKSKRPKKLATGPTFKKTKLRVDLKECNKEIAKRHTEGLIQSIRNGYKADDLNITADPSNNQANDKPLFDRSISQSTMRATIYAK